MPDAIVVAKAHSDVIQTVFMRSDGTETYYFNSQLTSKFM